MENSNNQGILNMSDHDPSTCLEMASIRVSLEHIMDGHEELKDSMRKLTDLMERQVRLEEQSAHHGAAVGRVFEQLTKLDERVTFIEGSRIYLIGSVKTLGMVAAVAIVAISWGLKSQLDIMQELPLKLDRIERQQKELSHVDELTLVEVGRLREYVNTVK